MTFPHVTDDLRKFLDSEYGVNLIIMAHFRGQEVFKFGKRSYKTIDLFKLIKKEKEIK